MIGPADHHGFVWYEAAPAATGLQLKMCESCGCYIVRKFDVVYDMLERRYRSTGPVMCKRCNAGEFARRVRAQERDRKAKLDLDWDGVTKMRSLVIKEASAARLRKLQETPDPAEEERAAAALQELRQERSNRWNTARNAKSPVV